MAKPAPVPADRATDAELAEILAEVRRIAVRSRRLATEVMAGGYASAFRGSGIEFDEVREYAEGDDPRTVDWNVTARIGRPFVKKFRDERDRTVLFLADLSASMTGGFGALSARETAARVVACLAFSATQQGDRVGLFGFGDGVATRVPPRKGMGHALRIVRDVLALPSTAGRSDPGPALELAARTVRGRRAVVFLVSDFLGLHAAAWERPLRACARRHDVVAVRLLAPELALPDVGLVRVEDPETGAVTTVDTSSPRVRDALDARVAAWRTSVDATLDRAKVDRLDVPVPRERDRDRIVEPLLTFFRMRELRGAHR